MKPTHSRPVMKRNRIRVVPKTWRWVAFVTLLVVAGAVLARQWLGDVWTVEGVHEVVGAYGSWAPLAFVVLYAIGLLFLLPGTPFTLAAGFLFGPLWGTVWAWLAGVIGAMIAYVLGRTGTSPVQGLLQRRFKRTAALVEDHSFATVFTLRVLPISPFPVINYALGMAGVRPWEYTWGTLVGLLPITAVYVLLGAAAGAAGDWRSPGFYGPLGVALALTGLGAWAAQRFRPTPRDREADVARAGNG